MAEEHTLIIQLVPVNIAVHLTPVHILPGTALPAVLALNVPVAAMNGLTSEPAPAGQTVIPILHLPAPASSQALPVPTIPGLTLEPALAGHLPAILLPEAALPEAADLPAVPARQAIIGCLIMEAGVWLTAPARLQHPHPLLPLRLRHQQNPLRRLNPRLNPRRLRANLCLLRLNLRSIRLTWLY